MATSGQQTPIWEWDGAPSLICEGSSYFGRFIDSTVNILLKIRSRRFFIGLLMETIFVHRSFLRIAFHKSCVDLSWDCDLYRIWPLQEKETDMGPKRLPFQVEVKRGEEPGTFATAFIPSSCIGWRKAHEFQNILDDKARNQLKKIKVKINNCL